MTRDAVAPVLDRVTAPPTSIKHLYCVCELNDETKTAFCGVLLGPTRHDRRNITPIELCIICSDIADTGGRICPKCGKASA